MGIRLRISDGSTVTTYDETQIELVGQTQIDEALSEGEIELEDVDLVLDDDFLGATAYSDLPATTTLGYRAALERESGEAIIEGRIPLSTLNHRPTTKAWSFKIVNSAAKELSDRLAAEAVVSSATTDAFANTVVYPDGERVNEMHTWHTLRGIWEASVDQLADVDFQYSTLGPIWFNFPVKYLDTGGDEQTYEREPDVYVTAPFQDDASPEHLPEWTADDLFGILRAMLGWRFSARYASFPSTQIIVVVFSDRYPPESTSGLAEIDDALEASSDPEFSFQSADVFDLALTYANSFKDEIRYLGDDGGGDPIFSKHLPEIAYVGASDFKTDENGRPTSENVRELALTLPQYTNEVLDSSFASPSGAPADYKEKLLRADIIMPDTTDRVYVATLRVRNDPSQDQTVMVVHHLPENPSSDQVSPIAPVWAANLLLAYQVSVKPNIVATVDVDMGALTERIATADPLLGVSFATKRWIVKELRHRIFDQSATLSLIRSAAAEGIVLEDVPPSGTIDTPDTPDVESFAAEYDAIFVAGTYVGKQMSLTWDDSDSGSVDNYEIEHREIGSGSGWQSLASPTSSPYTYLEDDDALSDEHEYRLRTVTGSANGNWAYATATLDEIINN